MFRNIENTYGEPIIININNIETIRPVESGAWGIKLVSGTIVYVDEDQLELIGVSI